MSDLSEGRVGRISNGVGEVSYGDDENLFVEFYKNPLNDRDYVRIKYPGDNLTEYDQPATDSHKTRFAGRWQAYQDGRSQVGDGTLLEDWPPMINARAMVDAYKSAGVFTVEQLAAVNDTNLSKLGMGARSLQDKAKAFVAQQGAADENAALKERLAQLESAMADMQKKKGKKKTPDPDGAHAVDAQAAAE